MPKNFEISAAENGISDEKIKLGVVKHVILH